MDDYKQFEIKEGIVFLIEVTPAILQPLPQGQQSQLYAILECIQELMSDMVITFPNNGIGIYLYGCENTGAKFPKNSGLNKVFSLNDLNSSNMKVLNNILHDHEDGFNPLDRRFAPSKAVRDNLHTVLKTVLHQYQTKPHYNYKKLFWFTNNDKPYVNVELKDSLRTMINDFEDNNIFVNPYFLETVSGDSSPMKHFDASRFEKIFLNTNFLKHAKRREQNAVASSERGNHYKWLQALVIGDIRKAISRLKEVRRTQFACHLVLSDGAVSGGQLGCSIKGYSLYNHETIKPFRQMCTESDHLKIVHNDSKIIRTDNEAVVEKSPQGQRQKPSPNPNVLFMKGVPVKQSDGSATEKVMLLSDDVYEYMRGTNFDHDPSSLDTLKTLEANCDDERPKVEYSQAPYLKLVCFRDVQKFQPLLNIHPALFVTADLSNGINTTKQGGFTNSFRTFRSLYQSCVKLNRFAVVFGCNKRNKPPDLYALYPTNLHSVPEKAGKSVPDGFLLITLPWLNEIRSLPDYMMLENHKFFFPEDETAAPPELVSMFAKLIDQFPLWPRYNPRLLPNPVTNYFYGVIKNEVLQIDVKEEDNSVEGNDWSARELLRVRGQVQANPEAREILKFATDVLNKIGNSDVMKRAAQVESEASNKRHHTPQLTEADIIALWRRDGWGNVTVAQLKEFIGKYDSIKSASRKADMIENIINFLKTRQRTQ